MKFKVGQKVVYLGYKNNLYGDTNHAERRGYLIPGKQYVVVRAQKDVFVTLDVGSFREWKLHVECVAAVNRYKHNLPDWF
jgi:hypothetical protein